MVSLVKSAIKFVLAENYMTDLPSIAPQLLKDNHALRPF